ncbi:uncharacterized protein PHACADRAFT_261539 [Phanerochaete carnosa HHB-10118-sp]|uniref:Uncharacterized protein n=1 Tax=Phanerochaete carnosa (strain HHB-10118-sp) TaxID=650164 RepID=K5W1A5_PHACS|nr:uncharacterized protein PHACADRAFT_261539 [Phanerochaete carnosa HHB-10118-sp]EKM52870.1 hypothetical protein PHACADRAFT_261539 [Phanerochaete carnosa HHB-10118-sp]
MSRVTGDDLPPEILSRILDSVTSVGVGTDLTERRRSKHELIGSSLVCKHWSEAIRPILFQRLQLRNAEDVRFLKNIVISPSFVTSSLPEAIQWVYVHQEATEAKSWLHHIHGLSTCLRNTTFECTVVSPAGDTASAPCRWAPFESIPNVTPSYVRLSKLTLNNIVFASTTELARLVDSFSTLRFCICGQLTFLDSSPVVQSRRARRHASSALWRCGISRCKDMAVSVQAALAADILAAGRRMGLDDRTWDTTLQALFVLVPSAFEGAVVSLYNQNGHMFDTARISGHSYNQDVSMGDSFGADIKVFRPSADQDAGSPLAHVESIALTLSFADVEAVDMLDWDALRAVIDSPHMHYLRIHYFEQQNKDFEAAKRILCSVLRRTQLTWALESGKLQFGQFFGDPATSADISSVPAEHTIDGTTITLDIAEQAEWLLHPVRRSFNYLDNITREEYLRRLVAARVSGTSADTGSEVAPPTAGNTQNTALEQTHEVADDSAQRVEVYEGVGGGGEEDLATET